ncbi:MAG: GNAT family N-acetyltransferase [Cyanobacteriota bacterium]|nr:GNAT family N-acetyltransferase [Cyanobacteriota bacterium]
MTNGSENRITAEISIRDAVPEDISSIFALIREKAEFDRTMGSFSGILKATPQKLSETLFGDFPFAKVLLAKKIDRPVGFALYYFRYSSFAARPSLWLDDLYVKSEIRHREIGSALMGQIAAIAHNYNCNHLAWNAIQTNEIGVRFYLHCITSKARRKDC